MSTFKSLGVLNYRIWFIGALVSNIGTWMQRTAQDWLVFAHLSNHDAGAMAVLSTGLGVLVLSGAPCAFNRARPRAKAASVQGFAMSAIARTL